MSTSQWIVGIIFCGAATLPLLKQALYPRYEPRLIPEKKTIIITGATGNLGACMVNQLAYFNHRVIMACRDMDKCLSLRREIVYRNQNKSIVCRHLDLSSIDSINKFVDNIIKTEPKIDVLINNAAIKDEPKKTLTNEGFEKMFFVNYLGPFLLTIRLLDKLTESSKITKDSRIINIVGKPNKKWILDLDDINFDNRKYTSAIAYRQSKLALAYFTQMLNELTTAQKINVFVYGIDPGWKRFSDSFLRDIHFWSKAQMYYQNFVGANPDHAVGSTMKCAVDPDLGNRESSGYLYGFLSLGWSWSRPANNIIAAKLLWNKTASLFDEIKVLPETKGDVNLTEVERKDK